MANCPARAKTIVSWLAANLIQTPRPLRRHGTMRRGGQRSNINAGAGAATEGSVGRGDSRQSDANVEAVVCRRAGGRRPLRPPPRLWLIVRDVVQLELDLSLDLVFNLDLDLGRVVGIQGGRVEIAGEDRRLREARHDDPMDVARPGGALHVELTRCRAS